MREWREGHAYDQYRPATIYQRAMNIRIAIVEAENDRLRDHGAWVEQENDRLTGWLRENKAEAVKAWVEVERLRGILDGEDMDAIERAARALHDREPWVYGQDGDGGDITKPWEEAPPAVRESYLMDALTALRAAGENAPPETDEKSDNGEV